MRLLNWLKGIRRSERGNVLVIAAATMPLFVGAAGMAVDSIQLSVWKRELQRAADSAAFAGAYAELQDQGAATAVNRDLAQNTHPALSQPAVVQVGPSAGFTDTVRVALTAQRTVPFMAFFTNTPTTITAEATAALVDDGEYCMFGRYNGTGAGITVNGNANVTLKCGMITNSRAPSAVTAGGSSTITAIPIAAAGGLDGANNNFIAPTRLIPFAPPQDDPLAHLPDPPPQSGCSPANINPQATVNLTPGCYSRLDIKGTATLAPGTYYVTGDVEFGAQANVTGNGVTIVMTGPNGQAGDLKINAGANYDLSAAETGDYAGVVFFRDRRSSNIEMKINGSSTSSLRGALYFPTSDIEFSGSAGMNVSCLQMVGWVLEFTGSANLTNNCPPGSASHAIKRKMVRLVG